MFDTLQNFELIPVSVYTLIANLVVALVCGIIISVVYRLVYRGPSYSVSFTNALVILSLITAMVIMVIGNNLARAFGLVGAMSIIRFRTAVRDVQDIVFIFFALGAGMASGVGLYTVAIASTVFISLVIIVLTLTRFGHIRKREYLLQITYHGGENNEKMLENILKKHCRKIRLVNLKSLGTDELQEVYYQVSLREENKNSLLISELAASGFVLSSNIYFDDDDVNPPNY